MTTTQHCVNTSAHMKLKILSVKSLAHYLVREVDTTAAAKYDKLEEVMQEKYNQLAQDSAEDLDVGSLVAVYVTLGHNQTSGPKRWYRAVVRNVFMSVGSYLYDVHLLDCGLDRCVKRSSIRHLRPHYGQDFAVFQAFDFRLRGFDPTNGAEDDDKLIKLITRLFKQNDCIVSTNIAIKEESEKKCLCGDIALSDGTDLAAFLRKQGSGEEFIDNTTVRKPKTMPFVRSANNSFVVTTDHCSVARNSCGSDDNKSTVSDNSIDSISSVEIAIDMKEQSDDSVIIESDDSSLEIRKSDLSDDMVSSVVNGMSGHMSGHKRFLGQRLKLMQQLKEEKLIHESRLRSDRNVMNGTNGSQKARQIVTATATQEEVETIEWPVIPVDRPSAPLKPAGVQPPNYVMQRIFTLKQQSKQSSL